MTVVNSSRLLVLISGVLISLILCVQSVVFNSNFVNIKDITGEKSIQIRMVPLEYNVLNEKSNVIFETKSVKKINLIYCGDEINRNVQSTPINVFVYQWIIPLTINDENTMLLLSDQGIVCKAIVESGIYLFKIYEGLETSKIVPVVFDKNENKIFHPKYHLWVQAILFILMHISIWTIVLIIYCCPHKVKLANWQKLK